MHSTKHVQCIMLACTESVLAEAEISKPLLDLHLLESLTGFQLFVACSGIPSECDSFRREFLSHAEGVLEKALQEGERPSEPVRQSSRCD